MRGCKPFQHPNIPRISQRHNYVSSPIVRPAVYVSTGNVPAGSQPYVTVTHRGDINRRFERERKTAHLRLGGRAGTSLHHHPPFEKKHHDDVRLILQSVTM